MRVLQDIAFLHAPTKTLIQADLLFNLPPTEQVCLRASLTFSTIGER